MVYDINIDKAFKTLLSVPGKEVYSWKNKI